MEKRLRRSFAVRYSLKMRRKNSVKVSKRDVQLRSQFVLGVEKSGPSSKL
jgi:hypothetical protein